MLSPRELLGPTCSEVGAFPLDRGIAAYVHYRGALVAAAGTDATTAGAALLAKVERFLPQLLELTEIAATGEVNLVTEQAGRPPVRNFARPMTPARALLELDLGIAGALVFREAERGTWAIQSRAADGTPQLVHLGEPVYGDDHVARPLPIPGRTPTPPVAEELRRQKSARIRVLLRCPGCRGELLDTPQGLYCAPCRRDYPHCQGKPLLCLDPAYNGSSHGKPQSQNTYGQQALELIERHRDGLVLDMGSGNPSCGFFNVVHLELAAYEHVDLVTDGRALPFADASFDAILSEAVLEHVRAPDEYMSELARVLKPGGRVRLDVAFLQPFHAYPDHYFNMTKSGLAVTVERAGLVVRGIGVEEHQQPWVALGLLLAGFVHGTADKSRRDQILAMPIREALDRLQRGDSYAFQGLLPEAVERLAAGFWCLAEKPS
jgi:SAM-dependent methyltransferase